MCPHPRIYPHISIHAHIFARTTYTHTCARALKQTRAYKTKNAFIDTTHNAHTYIDTLIR